jgi:hypothetical protein
MACQHQHNHYHRQHRDWQYDSEQYLPHPLSPAFAWNRKGHARVGLRTIMFNPATHSLPTLPSEL